MQIDRLLDTILFLIENKKTTAKRLAELYDVSIRTIYRDIDTLTLAGIPIYYVKGKNGGIFIDENYTINNNIVLKDEYLFLANKLLKNIGISKLEVKNNYNNWLEVEDDLSASMKQYDDILTNIKKAIIQKRKIKFIYYSEYGQTSLRLVNPYKVIYSKNGSWLLYGYCNDNENNMYFIIDGITSLELLSTRFNDFQIKDDKYLDETVSVRLRFSKRIAYKIYDEFKDKDIIKNDDGSYDIIFSLFDDESTINYILSFGSNIKIVEPEWMKEKIRKLCLDFLENNS